MFGALLGRAEAQEYCVACSEPNAVYRCVIEGAQPRGGQSLQMLCVTAMAKEGGHATCSVKGGTVFDCNGPVKRVSWAAINEHVPPGVSEAARPGCPGLRRAPDANLRAGAAANRAGAWPSVPTSRAAEQMKKAGETMKEQTKSFGDATKKTWDCVLSFFTRCGG